MDPGVLRTRASQACGSPLTATQHPARCLAHSRWPARPERRRTWAVDAGTSDGRHHAALGRQEEEEEEEEGGWPAGGPGASEGRSRDPTACFSPEPELLTGLFSLCPSPWLADRADGWTIRRMKGQGSRCSPSSLAPEAESAGPRSPVSSLSAPTPRRWRKVNQCAGTKELACSLMCLEKQDLYNKFKGRVWAVSTGSRSPPVESKYLDYLFDGRSGAKGPGGRLPVQALLSRPLSPLLQSRGSPT